MRCILAVDPGGTKCEALLIRDDGAPLGWGRADGHLTDDGSGAYEDTHLGSGRSTRVITEAVTKAIGDHRGDELFLTGFWGYNKCLELLESRFTSIDQLYVQEELPAYAVTGERYGIVVIAGTGFKLVADLPGDRHRILDGDGPMVGDLGGGYYIGMLAIRAANRSRWHPRHQTSLAAAVPVALGIEPTPANYRENTPRRRNHLLHYMLQPRDRSIIASLARIVDEEARRGDRIANEILLDAASATSETIWDLVDLLDIADSDYPMMGIGSIAAKSDIYWDHLCESVSKFAPRFRFLRVVDPPAVGIALNALNQLKGGMNYARARETLLRSYRGLVDPEKYRLNCCIPGSNC